ncbi:catechol O-methyltransferase-like [Asterias rubens]|uniref:catechol O-methyltransferase-like n=1 Tax=Asterias rubens TaxID=7604 RepID=UPI001454FA0D|nr:catechol O-methyltransferase-like [Asterias rubens]XP_033631178.1 catechol O-methyltransferase-like [Asterias rubens]
MATNTQKGSSPDFALKMVNKGRKMLEYVTERVEQGAPANLLDIADQYCYEFDTKMMHVGDKKGAIVRKIIKDLAPMTCLELGTYCGYSAVLMASVLPKGSRFLTVEPSKGIVEVAEKFIQLAGADVSEKIKIINKQSDEVIPSLQSDYSVDTLDFVFIDHWKNLYVRDIQLLETHGLLRKGTVILADNVIYPGAPEYLEYVKGSEKYDTEVIDSTLYSGREDGLAKSVYLG